jgi:hypothetical protein
MKKLRSFIFIIIALYFVFFNGNAQNNEQTVFGCSDGIFVVVNDKAQFYEFDGDSWVANSSYDFALPNGYQSVYGYNNVICVIINNKVRLYEFNGVSWAIDSVLPDFALPNGYGSVFGSKRNIGAVCVVVNNKVQLYGFGGTSVGWRTDSGADFTLPSGHQSLFGGSDGIGVAVGDKARIYEFKGSSGWVADSRYDLALPNGYRNVFGAQGDWGWREIGVVVDNKVQFYAFDEDNNSWATDSDWDFILPDR